MKSPDIDDLACGESQQAFVRRVLEDVQALELMIASGAIESGVRRIGAEQEVFLIDAAGAPAPVAMDVIESLRSPLVKTELALFNLEINLPPVLLESRCLSEMAATLSGQLNRVRDASRPYGADVLLAGILPTLRASDLVPSNLTPLPRYRDIDRSVSTPGQDAFQIHIRAVDDIRLTRTSLIVESGNCSFQVHLQVGSDEFPRLYNAAQAFAAPVLAAATNSPLLLGKRLWHETRIALFQQATDTRGPDRGRTVVPRVTFGRAWVHGSVLEIYREDIARFRPILGGEDDEPPMAVLARGGIPNLSALRLHNGTVWRWNRPCYGITDGRPHLRIENRILPSGPSIEDEIGNAALWLGLMRGAIGRDLDVTRRMEFDAAHGNFIAAARLGLDAQLHWFDGRTVPADRLLLDELIPFAYEGLRTAGVDPADIDRFLGVVARRVATRRTGSRWALDSLTAMEGGGSRGTAGRRLAALTQGMRKGQCSGRPVHEWPLARVEDAAFAAERDAPVSEYMTTDLFTVRAHDPIELAAHLMDLRGTHEVPVEDADNRLVGMISYPAIVRLVARGGLAVGEAKLLVSSIMIVDPITVFAETPIVEAIDLMMTHAVTGLPVARDGRLVGMVLQRDVLRIAREMFLERLSATQPLPVRRRVAKPAPKPKHAEV
jgi:CBS domain-containing protein